MSIRLMGPGGAADALPGVDIDADVVARAAAKIALEVKGVLELENAFSDGVAAALGRDGHARGVRVSPEPDGCVMHVGAVAKYGENIPEIAWNLQEHIRKNVEDIIGVRVKKVNILITGVRDVSAPQ